MLLKVIIKFKGLLIRVGIDLSYGGWNAPYREDGSFYYIPMQPIVPEVFEDSFQTNYDEFEKAFNLYVEDCELTFPAVSAAVFPELQLHRVLCRDP